MSPAFRQDSKFTHLLDGSLADLCTLIDLLLGEERSLLGGIVEAAVRPSLPIPSMDAKDGMILPSIIWNLLALPCIYLLEQSRSLLRTSRELIFRSLSLPSSLADLLFLSTLLISLIWKRTLSLPKAHHLIAEVISSDTEECCIVFKRIIDLEPGNSPRHHIIGRRRAFGNMYLIFST